MPNIFVVKKFVEDKGHIPQEFTSPNDAVLAERGLLLDYPDAVFVVQEVDGGGNEVPNREVNPRLTLKALEAEVKPKLAEIIGGAKAIIGETEGEESDPWEPDLKRIHTISESIRGLAERINSLFK